ncbi:hypothetical protein JVT61DRAFT_7037 [Boletus reticuloceps]|uniref:Uncharacterized protein n=1 Tax=Boletus reticuloceps TaxID=495285 RepID=A0A8I2YJC1_9AGAM|nr:hypothetical protein JVT61DRAFT_7037 [Boletus reticuloceps]
MQEEDGTFHCQSGCRLFVALPEQGASGISPLLPLVVTKQPESSADTRCPTSPPLSSISSSPATTSLGSGSPKSHYDSFHADIERSHQTTVSSVMSLSSLNIANMAAGVFTNCHGLSSEEG